MRRLLPALVCFQCGLLATAAAQMRPMQPFLRYEAAPAPGAGGGTRLRLPPAPRDALRLGLGGVVGGAAGLFVGGLVAAKLTDDRPCEDCGLEGLVYGGVIGELAAVPLGVHLANRRQGSYGAGLLGSLAVTGAGMTLAGALDRTEVLLAVPVMQIAAAIAIERATSRAAR